MLGFAVIDFRLKSDVVAVWLTSRITATRADHTNAVTIDLEEDGNALQKVHALTRDRLVVMTDGSTSTGLPIGADTLTVEDVVSLSSEIEAHRQRIVEAIDSYTKKTKNRTLVRPTFTDIVRPESVVAPGEKLPTQRAFQLANFVSRTWTDWLVTDDERRRRSTNPRTKKSPWIMPRHLSSSVIEELPANFGERFVPNPVEAFDA